MRVHHPCGAHCESSGGWAVNDALWKVSVCVCVCVRERERECVCVRARERERMCV